MSVVLRVYTSPLKFRRLPSMSTSSPTFVVAAVSHVSPSGSTAGARVWFGFVPFTIIPDCEMPKVCLNWYAPPLPLPIVPQEARRRRSLTRLGDTFQNGSCDTRHAPETDGKKAKR